MHADSREAWQEGAGRSTSALGVDRPVATNPHHVRAVFSMPHSAGPHREGSEYAIFAHGLAVPKLRRLGLRARFSPQPAV